MAFAQNRVGDELRERTAYHSRHLPLREQSIARAG